MNKRSRSRSLFSVERIVRDGGSRRGCHRSESNHTQLPVSFAFFSISRLLTHTHTHNHTHTTTHSRTDLIKYCSTLLGSCLFFCRVHNCQLLIQYSRAVLIIIQARLEKRRQGATKGSAVRKIRKMYFSCEGK